MKDATRAALFKGRMWDEPMSQEEALCFLSEVSAACVRGPQSEFCLSLQRQGKFVDLIDYVVPFEGTTVEDYRFAVQIQALYKKNPWIDLGFDPEAAAFDSFLGAELQCEATNNRLGSEHPEKDVSAVLYGAQRKIAQVLGGVPSLNDLGFRYGPGANTSVRRAQASMRSKLSATLACSEEMVPALSTLLEEVPQLVEECCIKSNHLLPLWEPDFPLVRRQLVDVRVDPGNLVFVPKNAKTHRPIVVEPILNGFFQLGVGSFLKERLLRIANIDLYDQENNRRLARKGSLDGSLTTIDLSNASDTLAYGCVLDLLPMEWTEFLGTLRTGTIRYRGTDLLLEKFSSMGNGFTFELESLIFWALARSCVEYLDGNVEHIGIFGDDIIVPVEATEILLRCLDWCGFTVNTKKSFWSGPFRESCGSDWLAGNDVRPFFIKEEVSDQYLYVFHNWMLRRGERELAAIALRWTNESIRLFGPDGYGDGHLLGSHDLYLPRNERRAGYGGGYFDTYALRPKRQSRRSAIESWLVPGYSVYTRSGVEQPTDPGVLPGTDGYVRRSVYTFSQSIFY